MCEQRVSKLLPRIMAGVRVAAGAVDLLSDPDEVTARWAPRDVIMAEGRGEAVGCSCRLLRCVCIASH